MFHPHSNTSHNWFFSGPCYILSWSLQLFRRVGLCGGGFLFYLNILVVCLLENVSLNNWWSLDSPSRDQKCSLSSLPLYGFHHGVYLRSSSLSLVSVFKLSARWFCLVSKKKMTTVNRSDQPFLKAHQSAECLTPSYKLKIINNTLRLCDSPHKQTFQISSFTVCRLVSKRCEKNTLGTATHACGWDLGGQQCWPSYLKIVISGLSYLKKKHDTQPEYVIKQ